MKVFKIKEIRKNLNLTIKELSIKSGVAIGYLSTLENDIKGASNPSREVMIKIADALETSAIEVFF
ncbi:helix-turn-helix domain-containing protein [Clostridium chromiireducens]|uniref:Helix-turn-helix domain protein n=1 Tax=Clostridium chromiireducens TaxID=225345 RepID=A0A1V4IEY9_9CLOT|nr:helix-turn-helix transcriptional regulator [Clostridium chromiireducens]OPJ58523.1 helix-turn-helix domain protein [Clostridium chromiireducens]RII32996.1 XRE family transcriptional regulator [Clostridium chromiireducens]